MGKPLLLLTNQLFLLKLTETVGFILGNQFLAQNTNPEGTPNSSTDVVSHTRTETDVLC